MTAPEARDLAHDLRNLVGLVQARTAELALLLTGAPGDAPVIARELDDAAVFAMEALRVLEALEAPAPREVHLGAWAWALRLSERELRLGELERAARATLRVPEALRAGRALIAALGGAHAIEIEATPDGALAFTVLRAPADDSALGAARSALASAGLRAQESRRAPYVVTVEPSSRSAGE